MRKYTYVEDSWHLSGGSRLSGTVRYIQRCNDLCDNIVFFLVIFELAFVDLYL